MRQKQRRMAWTGLDGGTRSAASLLKQGTAIKGGGAVEERRAKVFKVKEQLLFGKGLKEGCGTN